MILCLTGTSDARALAIRMKQEGFQVLTTVVTENAAIALQEVGLEVQIGRLTAQDMMALIRDRHIRLIVDASHPFAEEASKHARQAADECQIPYIRYERENQVFDDENMIRVNGYEEAAEVAAQKRGVIMLTTGSKTLHVFTERLQDLPGTRLLARMLPRKDNMEKCERLGVAQKDIIAIQGPFTKELNQALYKQYGVTLMITKESGKAGAVDEKIQSARELGITTVLIKRPDMDYGTCYSTFDEVLSHIQHLALK
ncbi:precorrin-6A reductase [Caldalkalibacillus salinus]|uniref:precorrin-6A reductase n=1 Tax=Caldalkalibacillus salinus TaxID=2803787 RepID=UPI0019250443|nr:precorrin-6A reductase [Caldalkalibacillus salinus]